MRAYLAAAVGILMLSAPARATVLVPADLGDLTREAATIARGRVVAVDTRWVDGRQGIETLVTIHAEAYL